MTISFLLMMDCRSMGMNNQDTKVFLIDSPTYTKHFRGFIIARFKGFHVFLNVFFTEFHFISWFMRYY
jgi:hypothetical protein